jgi:hypothetical protein
LRPSSLAFVVSARGDFGFTLWTFWLPLGVVSNLAAAIGTSSDSRDFGRTGNWQNDFCFGFKFDLGHFGLSNCLPLMDDLYKTYEERQRLQQEILAFEIWREVWYS